MTAAADARSGKGHRDENFPVASHLIHPRHRAPILAFYEFVRTADDMADHRRSARAARSSRFWTGSKPLLQGNNRSDKESDEEPVALALRAQLAARNCRRGMRSIC